MKSGLITKLGLIILFMIFAAGYAQFGFDAPVHEGISVSTAQQAAKPGGEKSYLAVAVNLPKGGWHIYSNPKGPGPGKPTEIITTSKNANIQFGEVLYSPAIKYLPKGEAPEKFAWAYEHLALFYVPFTVKGQSSDDIPIALTVNYLVCSEEMCVPGRKNLNAIIKLNGRSVGKTDFFSKLNQSKPGPSLVQIETKALTAGSVESNKEESEIPVEDIQEFLGMLDPAAINESGEVNHFWKAILFAFIAGLILNVMPCVLPVISIKIMGFVQQAGEDPKKVFKLGLAFASGILIVFLGLAILAVVAKYSWGALFQREEFLIGMIAIIFVFSLSLFGIFTIIVPGKLSQIGMGQKSGYLDSFGKGMMATLLATPCSGPFLGGAMAWTLLQSAPVIIIIFLSIGVGMALPYVILTANPNFMKWVPKPGNWMIHFERIMGFVLLGTVVYLFTIVPLGSKNALAGFLLVLGVGAYIYGKLQSITDPPGKRWMVRIIALVWVVFGGLFCQKILINKDIKYEAKFTNSMAWSEYSYSKLFNASDENRITVVDFTADWCPNCKVVEAAILESEIIQQAFREKNVQLLIADITREDKIKQDLLTKLGSRSIPFLAFFHPGEKLIKPGFLRDMYSKEDVLKGLEGNF